MGFFYFPVWTDKYKYINILKFEYLQRKLIYFVTDSSENKSMATISSGDFERIFKELYKPLCLFALRFTEKTEDAEDVVQQVFADVWDKNVNHVVIANIKSYLFQAVRNRSLTLIAQSTDMQQTTEFLADLEDTSEEEQMYQAERDARLWSAIDGLPAERKKIFLLSKRDGLKYQEIADELHLSVKTVENQMGKALKALRETAKRIYCFLFGVA